MKLVYLSLGSNIGDRLEHIHQALDALAERTVEARRVSAFYKTQPVGFGAQPWFVNCVVEAETHLLPLRLLRACQSVERALGRHPGVTNGPRPIDIDVLFYQNNVLRTSALTIPHPRLPERRFVLIPLRDLAPQLRHPVTQQTVLEMLQQTEDQSQVIKLKPLS